MREGFIEAHGGYRGLLSFQKAELVYDLTVAFCNRFVDTRSRTHDQIVQAARSGKLNIVEGSMASGTSSKSEIKLTGVARASLGELLADYQDFLRTHQLPIWDKDHPEALAIRDLGRSPHTPYESYASYVLSGTPETAANTVICLIHQTNFLLDRQLKALERKFISEGGLSERMTRARLQYRDGKRGTSDRGE